VSAPLEYDYPYQGTLIIYRADKETLERICPKTFMPVTLACNREWKKREKM